MCHVCVQEASARSGEILAKLPLEGGEEGQNWPTLFRLIILHLLLAVSLEFLALLISLFVPFILHFVEQINSSE